MARRMAIYWVVDSWQGSARGRDTHFRYLEVGSEEERRLHEQYKRSRARMDRMELDVLGRNDAYEQFPYYQLYLDVERCYSRPDAIAERDPCPGAAESACPMGQVQVRKIVLDSKKSKRHEIMELQDYGRPVVIVVSRRLRTLLESINVTGCRFVPCLDSRKPYTSDDWELESEVDEPVRAPFDQLIITQKVLSPPCVGNSVGKPRICPSCGAYLGFRSSQNWHFEFSHLAPVDFQYFDDVRFSDIGIKKTQLMIPIASGRIMALLKREKIRGLRSFMTRPRIPVRVINIRKRTACSD